jgi:hypothetical protein
MPLTDDELELAKNCYGYGPWGAPYWFIGIEERLDPTEKGDRTKRAGAFRRLNTDGLCDRREFHQEIGIDRWETELQPTWGRLIWLLKKYLKDPNGSHSGLLDYQINSWGNAARGDTCVTELSGLPSDSSREGRRLDHERFKDCRDQLNEIRTRRIEKLSRQIKRYEPKLVIFYGKTRVRYWRQIASCELQFDSVVRLGATNFAFTGHPNMHGRRGEEWEALGNLLGASNHS